MTENRERRATDPLIIEIHGMVQRMDQKMDDTYRDLTEHIKKDEKFQEAQEERLKPLEQLHAFFSVGWKIAALIFALGGVGGVAAWFRSVASAVPK